MMWPSALMMKPDPSERLLDSRGWPGAPGIWPGKKRRRNSFDQDLRSALIEFPNERLERALPLNRT
jgi:hypothetical protein